MSKEEYLNQLHKYLRKLPKQDYDDAMDYFEEYFQETDEAGAQKLIEEMGTPKEAARELIANLLDKKLDETYMSDENNDRIKTSGKKSSKGTFWVACLAILALPVGAPLLLVILAVLACVLVCVAIALVCVFIFAICLLLVGGKLWIRGLFAITTSVSGFAMVSGCGLFAFGIGILLVILTIEQNRCAMACQGCGAVLFLLKSSGITFHNPLLLSYHTKQLN